MNIREALTFDDVLLEPGPSKMALRAVKIYPVQEAGAFFVPAGCENQS